ncbi:MAG: DEAD/DEAH box helicase [Leptolyngbya sp. PLA3]|nr:MAG: DEAD/DEAH box helicase [Cyanobacteria bacterium CYA]MCE7969328.1 DEAD/DEAH box helicase [Leptolyngbya sp. PL-A3]
MTGTSAGIETVVLHACFTPSGLHLWAEDPRAWARRDATDGRHPFAVEASRLAEMLTQAGVPGARAASCRQRLPSGGGVPAPSGKLGRLVGSMEAGAAVEGFGEYITPSVVFEGAALGEALERLDEIDEDRGFALGDSVRFFVTAARVGRHLLVQQRFVPMLWQLPSGELRGSWHPWLNDNQTAERVGMLVRAMPPAARASADEWNHDPARIVEAFLGVMIDAEARRALIAADMFDTVGARDPSKDVRVAWMQGLLGESIGVPAPAGERSEMVRQVRRWIGALEERGESSEWRLLLRMHEPVGAEGRPDEQAEWVLSFHLQDAEQGELVVNADEVWMLSGESLTLGGRSLESPTDLLLAELGRASRLFPRLESVLDESEPTHMRLSTKQAYEFLREMRPILIEQGFGVEAPEWWDSPSGRLGARLRITSDPLESILEVSEPGGVASASQLGLSALVSYHWEIAIGDTTLSLFEFEQFAGRDLPLVRLGGRWVEIRPEDVQSAIKFISENPGGEMRLADAMRLAYGTDAKRTGIPVVGLEASGWVADVLGGGGDGGSAGERVPQLEAPPGFRGTLRPYQLRGLSWMAFLEKFGLGACLADDMGLGKTIQLLALLLHEREHANGAIVLPTLLVAPMSVVGNWMHEIRRFAPQLKTLVHHGLDRLQGERLITEAQSCDIVVTTYALAHRDRETLDRVSWGRIVLDEAQYIKNPAAKQSQAVRSFVARQRVALTGTPVENRLSELWSIMDFLNPGYLGPSGNFRKRFSVPIERYRDTARSEQLRGLVQPFILRRVKSDPTVVADLPEKLESREYGHLTNEQASLYESCVKRMLADVDQSEGISRRGVVLAALIRLKQICNHPSQLLKDHDFESGRPPDPSRSGKCVRLLEMLDEVLAEGDQALIFTQFRQMGHLLTAMLEHELDREILFLHGGTPQTQRQKIVETFQKADGTRPILILSLKAGGVGLNLTAATHVFHFDRWWNPAVENQATDRAYRIGQTRTVQVHKFVVRGTLEERIDEMIESKTELAERIIGAGERWLTELNTDQLRDLLTLRADAIGDEE